jgi:hypothetical protein
VDGDEVSPEVADKLLEAATALDDVVQLWGDEEQEQFDNTKTAIRRAWGVSLDEMVAEIRAFVAEGERA